MGQLLVIISVPDYSTCGTSLCKTAVLISANEVTHKECGPSLVTILGDFSHMLPVLHAMFRMQMDHYIGIPTSRESIFRWSVICSVLTADTVVTGNCL